MLLGVLWAGCVGPQPEEAEPEEAAVAQADTASDLGKALKEGSDWIGAYFSYAGAISLVLSLFGDTPEDKLHGDLVRLYDALNDVAALVRASSGEILSSDMANDVSDVGSESKAARRDLATYGTVPPVNAALYLDTSYLKIQHLLNNDHYWRRLFVESVTFGEWRTVTGFRPPVSDRAVWDYRWALPALIDAIPMRINTLLAADPTHLAAGTYNPELEGYRNKLIDALQRIEGNIACGFQIAVDVEGPFSIIPPTVTYRVHAICGDPFTGQEVTAVASMDDERPGEIPFYSYGGGSYTVFDTDDRWAYPSFATVGGLRARFWNQLADSAYLQNWMNQALTDARSQLRTRLGLFEVRRAIDNLYTVIHRDPGPVSGGRVRSDFPNICLSHMLSLSGGYNWVQTAGCDSPLTHTFGQTWTYDPTAARFRSSDAGQCLAILGEPNRPMQLTVVTTCNADDEAQRWSYDAETHRIRNAQTYVLDIYNGTTTPGATVWTYWDTGSVAQQWGFPSPWIIGGRGPGL